MAVINVVTAGVAIVGAVTSNKAAKKDERRADAAEDKQLAFDQERYDDWKETYGDLEDNLADYYGGLTGEYYESMGLETFQQEFETSMTNMRENLAQRGITDSGVAASLEFQGEISAAESKATIRRDSDRLAAEDKASFLKVGLGQNPASSLSSTMGQQALSARDRASASGAAAGKATGSAIGTVGTAISDYMRK
tara:strand:+ start:9519 stop:10103 length:585 start_codon:yes stop_codon:yes gene_type:complete